MKYIFSLLLLSISFCLFAQQKAGEASGERGERGAREDKLIQFSGIITDVDSNSVIPYVTITNITNSQRYAANYKGYFSIIVHPGDILQYTAIGFSKVEMTIPSMLNSSQYTQMVRMKSEITYLPMVRVLPWATAEEFTKDFLSLKIADDDYEIARKNLSGKKLSGMLQTLSRDAGEISNINWRLAHDRALNKNMVQTNPLLNPFAWGKLMQQIFNGDKTRESDN